MAVSFSKDLSPISWLRVTTLLILIMMLLSFVGFVNILAFSGLGFGIANGFRGSG